MLYQVNDFIKRGWNKLVTKSMLKTFGAVGKNVSIMEGFYVRGNKNIFLGNNISIGPNATFMCTGASVIIGNDVMLGPNVTMITGNHRIDLVGKKMIEVTGNEKLPENDQSIILEGDNWIGANATILKNVKIGVGAVVAADSLVNKDVPPYAIVAGVPASVIRMRFSEEEIIKHKSIISNGVMKVSQQ